MGSSIRSRIEQVSRGLSPLWLAWALSAPLALVQWVSISLDSDLPLGEKLAGFWFGMNLLLAWATFFGAVATGLMLLPGLRRRLASRIPSGPSLPLIGAVTPLIWSLLWLWPIARVTAERPDVYLIMVDTLRDDYVNEKRTPNMVELARDGVRFGDAHASSPWTLPSVASMFTGLFPEEHLAGKNATNGAVGTRLRGDIPVVSGELREAGYRSVGIVSNFYLDVATGLARGFDVYRAAYRKPLPFLLSGSHAQDLAYLRPPDLRA